MLPVRAPCRSHLDLGSNMRRSRRHTSSVEVAGRYLSAPKENPEKILIIGDTGCRLSSGHGVYQACNNSGEWPLSRLTQNAAFHKPDSTIYNGDYSSREPLSPHGNSACKGSLYGDTQATWGANWLGPAHALHFAAPMILTRGNHETCKRAGDGRACFPDAHPYQAQCKRNTLP